MRYQETGEVHLDFHGVTNTTIEYLIEKYGIEALREILFKTGRDVYRDLRQHLEAGNREELVRFWEYCFDREAGDYTIEVLDDSIALTVRTCPAVRHVQRLGLPLSPHFCDQTEYVNRGICDGTPFEIVTELTGTGSCRQVLRRRHDTK